MLMTEDEQALAIKLYGYGHSFQEIAQQILENREGKIFYKMVREVGEVCGVRIRP